MKRRIKESKNIFPCTVYMENQDYDEVYYYLDTPEYGLSWRYFDDVEQEDIENYKYIIKNIADLRKAIDDLEEDFIHGYGNSYFKLSENYMEDLLNRGKTLVRVFNVKKEHKERVYIIRVKPAQNVELATVIKESTEDNTETGDFVVTDLSDDSYKNLKVKRVKIADGVTAIEEEAFYECRNLTEVIIPDSVTTIGKKAFEFCIYLNSITIPNSVTFIGKDAFSCCYNLKSIIIPNSVTSIEERAFEHCMNLASITIPNSVTTIKRAVFSYCQSLTEIIIPEGVTDIEDQAFRGCNSLKSITIPKSVTTIGRYVFKECETGRDIDDKCVIHYMGTRDQWDAIKKDPDWKGFNIRNLVINYQESSTSDESSVELALAESFEKTIKNLQKEGLFENVSSFDLNFNGKGINIKLNEGAYEWGANFGHNIDDDIEDNEDVDYYTARPDKLFKSEEAAIRACEKYCDANPSDYCEVLHYHADSGWQVSEEYDGFYD